MTDGRPGSLPRLGYWALLAAVSLWMLSIFLRPALHHVGINQYERSLFVDMVEGTAYQPYVHRVLLPLVVRGASALVPEDARASLASTIRRQHYLRRAFERLYWEPEQAHRYVVAALLMVLSYVGFAHFTARLAVASAGLPDTLRTRAAVGTAALLGLPPFFIYTSFPYDPPQLFLFALALFLLATRRAGAFAALFVACCLNKETAVLLIPIWALTMRDALPRGRYVGGVAWLSICYLAIKLSLVATFRDNPGAVAELHGLDHNAHWLTRPWTLPDVVSWSTCGFFFFFRWGEKPRFLKTAFLCILPPLVVLAFFLGYIDEWRGYYEAYPVVVALAADTVRRLLSGQRAG
jgi:hypothetical protein